MVAPDLSLSGKLIQHDTLVDSGQRVDYSFQLALTDLHSGLAIWKRNAHFETGLEPHGGVVMRHLWLAGIALAAMPAAAEAPTGCRRPA